jgi:hypothetical protein
MRRLLIIVVAALVAACASPVVTVNLPSEAPEQTGLAHVTVRDARTFEESASKREAAFGTPMGYVNFNPPEATVVQNLLTNELNVILRQGGVTAPQDYSCDIIEFGVNTNATLVYWDVVGHIRLALKHGNAVVSLYGTDQTRTFVWPGEDVIAKVMKGSLAQISTELKKNAEKLR